MRTSLLASIAVMMWVASGCGGSASGTPDAGAADAGVHADGGLAFDAGTRVDAGDHADDAGDDAAELAPDAGAPDDAGTFRACTGDSDCAELSTTCRSYSCLLGYCLPTRVELGCPCVEDIECTAASPTSCHQSTCEAGVCAVHVRDTFCSTTADTCTIATRLPPVVSGLPYRGSFAPPALPEVHGCSPVGTPASQFLHVHVDVTSDVRVDFQMDVLTLPRSTADAACMLDCVPMSGSPLPPECCVDRYYDLALEPTCGDRASRLPWGPADCLSTGPSGFFGPSNSHVAFVSIDVPPGDYVLEIRAGGSGPGDRHERPFEATVTISPSLTPTCDDPALDVAADVSGTTVGHGDALHQDCWGEASFSAEAIHPLVVTTRSRVRVTFDDPAHIVRTRIMSACERHADIACEQTACLGTAGIERVLDPGTYYVAIEALSTGYARPAFWYETHSTFPYTAHVTMTAPDVACSGAALLAGTGTYTGDTSTEPDRLRLPSPYSAVCAETGSAGDAAYHFTVAAGTDVTLALVEPYTHGLALALFRGCGETLVGGGVEVRHLTTHLDPGDYTLFVSSGDDGIAGPYTFTATFTP